MIDPKDLRDRPAEYREACRKKNVKIDIDALLKLDSNLREIKTEVEARRATQNSVSKELPKLSGADREAKLQQMKELVATLKSQEEELKKLEEDWRKLMLRMPSIPLPEVPEGKDDSENVELRKWGKIREFDFAPKDHVDLGQHLDILDVERGVKIAGARNYFLKGDGTRLQHAVLNFAMDLLHRKGYVLMDVPHIVKYRAMEGTSYFPGGEEQAYHLDARDEDSYLIGTAEVSVTSYHADEILDLKELPKRYAGYSPCYRREAGTYGKDARGIYRIHQFYKVEQVIVCEASAEVSAKFHAEILGNAEEVLQALELPYRVVDVCTGDMGLGQVYKNDIEAWMPSRKGYGETHSCSTFYEFQARRLNLRYRNAAGKTQVCHTLNNTCIASPRILIPILENYQQADGTVIVPNALRPYLGGQEVIKPRSK